MKKNDNNSLVFPVSVVLWCNARVGFEEAVEKRHILKSKVAGNLLDWSNG